MKTCRAWLIAIALAILIVPATAQAATIGGTVSAAGGGPIEGIQVCANKSWIGSQCAATGIDGKYEITGLGDGKYTVQFDGGDDYVDSWFDGATQQYLADPVTVAGGDVTGIDAELEPAGKFEGTVVDALSGAGIEEVRVCPYLEEGFNPDLPCATTDADGNYMVGGIPAGSYLVAFSAGSDPSTRDYLSEFFDDAPRLGQATPLSVSPGATVSDVDAALAKGGQISGSVSGEGGQPIANVQVCAAALGSANATFDICASTDADGKYAIHRLATGSYKIRFSSFPWLGNYLDQYYDDQPSRKTAAAVDVTAPSIRTGIDATLHSGGQISGTITAADTASPLNQAEACATRVGSAEGREYCAHTAADGIYTINSLPSGNYEVTFSSSYTDRQYLSERYEDQPIDGSGKQLAVTAGQTLSNVNAALARGASISGHVEDAVSGDPLMSISVCPLLDGRLIDEYQGCILTDSGGDYEFLGLQPGTYTVRFEPGVPFGPTEPADPRYATQFFDGATSPDAAQPVELAAEEDATGIDAQMSFGTTVSGTITGSDGTSLPSGYACTVLENKEEERCGSANKQGVYAIRGLSAGSYVIRFGANGGENGGWLPEYWDDEPSAGLADELTVPGTPTEIEDVDVELAAAGAISGRVTAAATGAPIEAAFVCAIPDGETEASNCSETWPNGKYMIGTLPTGAYRVEFSVARWEEGETVEEYETQFYSGAGQLEAGSLVNVTAGSTTGSIDAAMLEAPPPPPDPGGSGDGGSSSEPPRAGEPLPPSKPKPLKPHCRKGFKAKKVHGRWRCVKKKKHRPHHKQHR